MTEFVTVRRDALRELLETAIQSSWSDSDEKAYERRLEKALADMTVSPWQPMETAPKHTAVLLWWPHWDDRPVTGSNFGCWLSSAAMSPEGPGPIAWQPLPLPPEPKS